METVDQDYTPTEVMNILLGEVDSVSTEEALDCEIALQLLPSDMRVVAEHYREGYSMEQSMQYAGVTGNPSRYLEVLQLRLTDLMNRRGV